MRRIGVYVCHCGGNISDYVDVERVVAAVESEPDVVVARHTMFTCSDATQQEIAADIRDQELDGLVVASCSPKLHTFTFRDVARRAGLNPYEYTQVNVREQCSWTHTDDHEGATRKAIDLVRAGIARTRLTEPLEPTVVETTPAALVIGGGVAGMRAAIGLADIGLAVFLVEREAELGGWVAGFGEMYPRGKNGRALIERLAGEVRRREAITVFTSAELTAKSGTFGNYRAVVHAGGESIHLEIGQIVVATGFDTYEPADGELGYGTDGVVTLPQFTRMLDESDGPLVVGGRAVESIAYVYCVGSRDGERSYCSRYCCNAAVHSALLAADRGDRVRQYHFYRDLRAYGEAPTVARGEDGTLTVTARDLLSGGEEIAVRADLVVLVTGMVPRENGGLIRTLKLPVGRDGFLNEIHPKLRPVETVVDGVLVAGACQGPKSSAESVASGLAAVTQAAAVLKRGTAELDPQVAVVHADACTACGECVEACPFGAISIDGVAAIDAAGCKGCGGCAPVCPEDAIDLQGYTDAQMRAMIDGLAGVAV